MDVPLSSRSDSCFYVGGDVQVHPSAAIASGVFLQADPGSRLVVGPGVSIGSTAVIHAQGGVLSIATQVTLGTGVLLMGRGRIGAGACIGANSTLLASIDVAQGQLIDAGTILGEQGLFGLPADQEAQAPAVANHTPAGSASSLPPDESAGSEYAEAESSQADHLESESSETASFEPDPSEPDPSEPDASGTEAAKTAPRPTRKTEVYGKIVVERLMRMMSSP